MSLNVAKILYVFFKILPHHVLAAYRRNKFMCITCNMCMQQSPDGGSVLVKAKVKIRMGNKSRPASIAHRASTCPMNL